MSEKIRTILLVTLVAVLIWLWAEGESLSTMSLNPSVSIVEDTGELLILPDEDWRGTIRLRLQGSTRALTEAENALGSQLRLKLGQGGIPAQAGDRQIVNLEDAIRQLPEIRAAGLSVQEVTPAITVVKIVRLVTRDLPVRAAMPTDVDLLNDPIVTPPRVMVTMPEELAQRLTVDAYAVASLSKEELGTARDDTSQTLHTTVLLPASLADGLGEAGGAVGGGGPVAPSELGGAAAGITISPEKVSVMFRLKRSVDSVTLASSPVWFSLPPTEGNKWDIDLTDQFLRDVTFTGPTDAIAKIRLREVIPIAEVRLSSDDLEKPVETKEAVFVNLPPGVESGVAVKTVRLKITARRRPGAESPADLGPPEPVPAEAIDQD